MASNKSDEDNGLDEFFVVPVGADAGDEGHVDFQGVAGDLFQVLQGGIAGAEIVDRDLV